MKAERRATAVAVLVACTYFMELLDGTIVSTAAPAMGRDLGVSSASIGLSITAYFVTLALVIPFSGWITDRLGSRTVFVAAIVIFTLASGLCAASTSLLEVCVCRVLQGVGGALMVPVGRLVVLKGGDRQGLVRAIAILTWPALVAPIIAPFLGGVLVQTLSWHWIFLINIPLGLVAVPIAIALVPQTRTAEQAPFDWLGSAWVLIGLGSVVGLTSLLTLDEIPYTLAIVAGALGALGCWLAVRHSRRAEHPFLSLDSFGHETFRVANTGGMAFRLAVSAVPFVLPLLLQDAWGLTPVQAGAMVLWVFVGNLAIKPTTTPLLRLFGYRPVLIASCAVAAASVVLMAFMKPDTPTWLLAALLFISGAARSVGFTAYNTIAFADVDQSRMTEANTLFSTLSQVAAGLGVAVAAATLKATRPLDEVAPAAPYTATFLVIAAVLGMALLEALFMSPSAGEVIRPPRLSKRRRSHGRT